MAKFYARMCQLVMIILKGVLSINWFVSIQTFVDNIVLHSMVHLFVKRLTFMHSFVERLIHIVYLINNF